MSQEDAHKFLSDVVFHSDIRQNFKDVSDPQDFIQVCHRLGYNFTTEELKAVLESHSEGVNVRRKTGVWSWLRQVNWI